jgi:hypothetical protein
MTPNPNAFTRASTFAKAINAFKSATGLSVKDGKITTFHDGSKAIQFNDKVGIHPFYASGTASRIRVNAGFVTFAGKTYYFPSTTYSGASPGGVFIELATSYTSSSNGEGVLWSVMPVTTAPQLVWMEAGTLGSHSSLAYGESVFDPVIVGASGTLYIPIAGWSGNKVLNFIKQNVLLMPTTHGPISYLFQWG